MVCGADDTDWPPLGVQACGSMSSFEFLDVDDGNGVMSWEQDENDDDMTPKRGEQHFGWCEILRDEEIPGEHDFKWCEISVSNSRAVPNYLDAAFDATNPIPRTLFGNSPCARAYISDPLPLQHKRIQPCAGPDTGEKDLKITTSGQRARLVDKTPLSARAARLEGKRNRLHGKTGNKMPPDHPSYKILALGHPQIERTHACDMQSIMRGQRCKPYYFTAFEMEGCDASYSLNCMRAWESVPDTLERHSVIAPCALQLRNGLIQTTFHLAPTIMALPDAAAAAAEHALRTQLHVLRGNKPKLWKTLATEPPKTIRGDPLKLKMQAPSGCRQTALVRNNHHYEFWPCNGTEPLTMDLGSTCLVTDFSTQGRHPLTFRYPDLSKPEVCEQLPAGRNYKGPFWTVLKGNYLESIESQSEKAVPQVLQYVVKYELLWRADSGRQWNSLGVFRGNNDPTTEVAHSLSPFMGGLKARYLRLVPLETAGGGALRVGVYGHVARHGVKAGGGDSGRQEKESREQDTEFVKYTLKRVAIDKATGQLKTSRYVHKTVFKFQYSRCLCPWCQGQRRRPRPTAREMCAAGIQDFEREPEPGSARYKHSNRVLNDLWEDVEGPCADAGCECSLQARTWTLADYLRTSDTSRVVC